MLTRRIARPEAEARIEARATKAECRELAALFDLPAVHAVEAVFAVRPLPGGGLELEGRVAARIRRLCVVTAELFDEDFAEPETRRYLPGPVEADGREVEVALLEEDAPDPLPPEGVDLMDLVCEVLALGLDPHPRAPGADIAELEYDPEADEEPAGPFAALAAMKEPLPGPNLESSPRPPSRGPSTAVSACGEGREMDPGSSLRSGRGDDQGPADAAPKESDE